MTATAITTRFDPLFAKYAGALPIAFMRALSKRESNMNPNEQEWPAWGLMQVVPVVREGYNKRFGTSYSHPDLLDPDTNVKIAAELLNRIVTGYAKHSDPNLKTDWSNPEFVKLVVAGWNSGYSEAGGVGKVASYLESRGIPVTHDSVFAHSAAAGATKHLRNPQKQAWQRSVAELYFKQPDSAVRGGKSRFVLSVGIAVGLGLLAARYVFR